MIKLHTFVSTGICVCHYQYPRLKHMLSLEMFQNLSLLFTTTFTSGKCAVVIGDVIGPWETQSVLYPTHCWCATQCAKKCSLCKCLDHSWSPPPLYHCARERIAHPSPHTNSLHDCMTQNVSDDQH